MSAKTTMTGKRKRRARPKPETAGAELPSLRTVGGRLNILGEADINSIHTASLELLKRFGLSEAPEIVVGLVCAAGGAVTDDGRLIFPAELVDRALMSLGREVTLFGRDRRHDLQLDATSVHVGSGGAAPMILDMESGRYRASTLSDLYDAARLVDALPHVEFFARSLVARDMDDDRLLDINTCYAALAGTAKHVIVSASAADHVDDIAAMCGIVAGGRDAFAARPFLSLNINHVAPPMRFSQDAAKVLVAAAKAGIPCMVNTFGQLGASSPVTVAGCLAQSNAETLAGMVIAWLANPETPAIYGARPMVTDLRSGGMAGGSGEQAVLTAAASQMARYYGLPNSTIAGATDSKMADAQSGYEKALSVTMAAQAGANLITQTAGMQAGLMGASLEAYVIDNDMLGAIRRSLAPVELSAETLCPEMIADTIRTEGHFLGHPQTFGRMKSDFLYPDLANRQSIEEWEAAGSPEIRAQAKEVAARLLDTHFPAILNVETDAALRRSFDIRLPLERMQRR
jgi:trimethylamine--corrinoid protein Co-methyltransferase